MMPPQPIVHAALLLLLPAALLAQAKPQPNTIVIKNMAYAPPSLSVKAGESVTWTNQDDRDHTVTAEDKSFNSGNISSGKSFTHRFAKPGTYKYGCAYHPRMKGTITVTQ